MQQNKEDGTWGRDLRKEIWEKCCREEDVGGVGWGKKKLLSTKGEKLREQIGKEKTKEKLANF